MVDTFDLRFHNPHLKQSCPQCDGVGTVTTWIGGEETGTIDCPTCDGTGNAKIAELDLTTVVSTLSDILDKCNDTATAIADNKQLLQEIKAIVEAL
jgi:excinuclease UvrABC ATPase subunit